MGDKRVNYSFGMEKMKQKDEEAKLDRMNTKQKRGTPTVILKIFLTKKNRKFALISSWNQIIVKKIQLPQS